MMDEQRPLVEVAAVDPPAWMSDDARSYWADLMRHLPERVVKAADAHTFGMLCNELATYAEADEVVQRDGLMVSGFMGAVVPNPALAVRERAQTSIARWYHFLGIAPGERAATAREQAQESARGGLRHRVET